MKPKAAPAPFSAEETFPTIKVGDSSFRDLVLENAQQAINGSRQKDYGDAKDSFTTVGRIWGAILQIAPLEPDQVALMLAGLKMARLAGNLEHWDSWVDMAGYTALGGEIAVTQ